MRTLTAEELDLQARVEADFKRMAMPNLGFDMDDPFGLGAEEAGGRPAPSPAPAPAPASNASITVVQSKGMSITVRDVVPSERRTWVALADRYNPGLCAGCGEVADLQIDGSVDACISCVGVLLVNEVKR